MSVPPSLKPIGHFVKIANEHSNRDPVLYYWCLYYAVQNGMKIDKTSPDAIKFLTDLLGTLEIVKKKMSTEEGITNEIVAQAHIEDVTLKLFIAADNKDRAGIADKNVVKAFYTAGHLFDVLTTFGELDEALADHRKYAKWKAAYIHQCLKEGQTPQPGPPGWTPGDDVPQQNQDLQLDVPQIPSSSGSQSQMPAYVPQAQAPPQSSIPRTDPLKIEQAQKLSKMAESALDYEDIPTAIIKFKQAVAILESMS